MSILQPTHQEHLVSTVRSIFPKADIITNARKTASILNLSSGKYVELDVWVPSHNICFEFQDTYHYVTTWYSQTPLLSIQQADNIKREMIVAKGDTLITVPCWWEGDAESLKSSIKFQRPDIDVDNDNDSDSDSNIDVDIGSELDNLIPLNAEHSFFENNTSVSLVSSSLMLASFPTQFDGLTLKHSPWWVGEKYDGVRCCWDHTIRRMYTRNSVPIPLPLAMTHQFIQNSLDGELWFGRGCFLDAQRVVQPSADYIFPFWDSLRVIGFDEPSYNMWNVTFEKRYKKLVRLIDNNHPFITITARMGVKDMAQITNFLKTILQNGGEGLILQKAKSKYEPGRSESLFKLKAARGDQEGLVIGVSSGKCQVQLADGNIIEVPLAAGGLSCSVSPVSSIPEPVSSISSISPVSPVSPVLPVSSVSPVYVGDVVTISYSHYSRRALPVNASLVRVRRDISWQLVLANHLQETLLSESSSKVVGFTSKPQGFWRKNLRAMLERFAKIKSFDPLLPDNWYSIRYITVLEFKEMTHASLAHYNGSFIKALQDVFPEIGIDESKFTFLPKGYWQTVSNRRELFSSFAKQKKFDPLIASNWYSIEPDDLRSFKGATSMLRYYSGSVVRGLLHVYPDINLDQRQFPAKLLGSYFKEAEKWTTTNKAHNTVIQQQQQQQQQQQLFDVRRVRLESKILSALRTKPQR